MSQVRNIHSALSQISQPWQPHRLVTVNEQEVKAVKLLGEFVWHDHPVDELFFVIAGELAIDLRPAPTAENSAPQETTVHLGPGDMYVVPRGVEHRPRAAQEVSAMLFEPRGVVNTGNAGGALTSAVHELE
jgi:mannose-6-phosphate isomerase-like protein (cupin superfamily)